MDFLDKCSSWLDSFGRSQLSQTVDIRSGGAKSLAVPATIGMYEYTEDSGDGVLTIAKARDYFIAVADYQLDGIIVVPETGHHIVENGRTYEVVSPGGESCARYSDAYNRTWRIHTKLISE